MRSSAPRPPSFLRLRRLPVPRDELRYRLGVAVRALTAIVGGYLLSALAAACLALALPTTRLEAAVTGTLLAFVVYPGAVVWVFAARSARRALLGIALPCAALGALVLAHLRWGSGA